MLGLNHVYVFGLTETTNAAPSLAETNAPQDLARVS